MAYSPVMSARVLAGLDPRFGLAERDRAIGDGRVPGPSGQHRTCRRALERVVRPGVAGAVQHPGVRGPPIQVPAHVSRQGGGPLPLHPPSTSCFLSLPPSPVLQICWSPLDAESPLRVRLCAVRERGGGSVVRARGGGEVCACGGMGVGMSGGAWMRVCLCASVGLGVFSDKGDHGCSQPLL